MNPIQAIKAQCIECMGGVRSEVARCTAPKCSLFRYRFGTEKSSGWTPERREVQRQRMLKINASKLNDKQKGGA